MKKYNEHINCIEKIAALKNDVKLRPHQERVVNNPNNTIIVAHGVGSGKTLTGIAKFEKMKEQGKANKALVVVPAGLRENFGESGVAKFTDSKYNIVGNTQERQKKTHSGIDPKADYNIISYELFRRNPNSILEQSGADTVIYDENHRAKNEGTATLNSIKQLRPLYKNHIGLTGSVISNSVADIHPLVDTATDGEHSLGLDKSDFLSRYVKRSNDKKYLSVKENKRPIVGFYNPKKLGKELTSVVDYMDYDDIKEIADMPNKDIRVKKVPISNEQKKLYKDLIRDNPEIANLIKKKRLETLGDDEIASSFSKLVEARKLMNSVGSVVPGISLEESYRRTPKTKALVSDLDKYLAENPNDSALVFSHLINGGIDVLEAGLKDKGIEYGKFIGKGNKGITEATRQQDIRDYNDGKKRVLLISGAGGEGLSLNDTSYEAVLDPHYNPEKMNQMEARGIRSGGLKGREDRTVHVDRYISTMPRTLGVIKSNLRTPDEVIYEIANRKAKDNQLLYDLLKKYRE